MAVYTNHCAGEVVVVDEAHPGDTGCEYYEGRCTECPFPECKDIVGMIRFRRTLKLQEVERLWQEGKSPEEIALQLKVSLRTVHRRLLQLG